MNIEIIRPHGDLKRERWTFSLMINFATPTIYWDSYIFEARENTRHKKWSNQSIWTRLNKRDNTTTNPPLPDDVKIEVRKTFASRVVTLLITQ